MLVLGLAAVGGWLFWGSGAEDDSPLPASVGPAQPAAPPSPAAPTNPASAPILAQSSTPPGLPAGFQTLWVTRITRLRDAPTSDGSSVIATLGRGDQLSGEWIMGRDGETPWLRVNWEDGQGYAWGANLSEVNPPRIIRDVSGNWQLAPGAIVRAQPRDDAREVDRVSTATPVDVVGLVADDWVEIARASGGVGYVRPAQFQPDYSRTDR